MVEEFDDFLVVFLSNNHANYVFNELRKKGVEIEIVTTPCKISSGCSQSIRFRERSINRIKEVIKKFNVPTKGIYKLKKVDWIIEYVFLENI